MRARKRRSDGALRGKLRSPGRPGVAWREDRRRFWTLIAAGLSSEDAAVGVGASQPVGSRWFREAVEYATLEWVDWYNTRRILAPIGKLPPAEAEARYNAQLEPAAMAA
jgi:transposase InsO family protein